MAKWNRRQILSGLLAAVGAEASFLATNAIAQASPLPASKPAEPPRSSADLSASAPLREVRSGTPEARSALSVFSSEDDMRRMLPPGLRFGRWRVLEVHRTNLGGIPVILEGRNGVRFQVDLLARDRRPGARRGIAQTRHYSLYLANLGRGAKPTREEHGLGVLWLAALLRTRENARPPVQLLTLRERLVQHPTGRFDKLRADARPTPPRAPVRAIANATANATTNAAERRLPDAIAAIAALPASGDKPDTR
jgi:hypothetical protein